MTLQIFCSETPIRTLANEVNDFYSLEYSLNFDEVQDFATLAEDPLGE